VSGYRELVLALNPVAYWRLGESAGTVAVDETGTQDGTYNGGITKGVTGALTDDADTAADFDAVSGSYISVPTDAAFDAMDRVSVAGWFQINVGASLTGTLLRRGSSGEHYFIRFTPAGKRPSWHVYNQALAFVNIEHVADLNDDLWHFAVGTWDGTNSRLYIDGLESTNSPQALAGTSIGGAGANIGIGSHADAGTSELMNGALDEVAIFRRALSAREIRDLYDRGVGNYYGSSRITLAETRIVRNEGGVVQRVSINAVSTGTITLNDSIGTRLVLGANYPVGVYDFAIEFAGKIEVVTTAACDLTVFWSR